MEKISFFTCTIMFFCKVNLIAIGNNSRVLHDSKTSLRFHQMDSIGENAVVTFEKQSNFIPVLRSGDWSDIGNRPYMEDAHVCIPNLTQNYGDKLSGKEIVSFYGVSSYFSPSILVSVRRNREIERTFFTKIF